jgi:hypothetical protein
MEAMAAHIDQGAFGQRFISLSGESGHHEQRSKQGTSGRKQPAD